MKVKPRLRYMPHAVSWKWYMYIDVQIEGLPVENRIHGFGWTPEGALQGLHESLVRRNIVLQRHGLGITVELPGLKIPDHCLATSNLPWWKRLFRI